MVKLHKLKEIFFDVTGQESDICHVYVPYEILKTLAHVTKIKHADLFQD